jgi:hypothetical protein
VGLIGNLGLGVEFTIQELTLVPSIGNAFMNALAETRFNISETARRILASKFAKKRR